jgi:metal-responsive CopG/Arc/MetJ family transcriptional regulator
MGRPKVEEPRQPYTVMLKPSVVAEIDRIRAIRGRRTRSEMMSNLIDQGLEDMQTLEKMGIIQAVVIGDKVFKKLKEAIWGGDIKLNEKGDLEIRK